MEKNASRMKGKRKDDRSILSLPLQLTIEQDGVPNSITGSSRLNLSKREAYVRAMQKISKGGKVLMTFTLPIDYMDQYEINKLRVNLEGKVIRSEKSWFAVKLANKCSVSTVSS